MRGCLEETGLGIKMWLTLTDSDNVQFAFWINRSSREIKEKF